MRMRMVISLAVCCCLTVWSCRESEQGDDRKAFREYMLMNVFQGEGFSFLPYYIVKDVDGQPHRLDSLFKTPKLVFRFSQSNCDQCIHTEMKHLSKLGLLDDVIGLAGYDNIRKVKLAKRQYDVKFPIYYLPTTSGSVLPDAKEQSGMPYFFYVDQQLRARYVFTPSQEFPDVSRQYLNEIKELKRGGTDKVVLFDSLSVDLGEIIKGRTYKARFTYTNRTDRRLVINDVKTSCGCMVSEWRKEPLEAGQSDELVITFKPDATGYNSKIITVSHNLSQRPVRLRVTANVNEEKD